MRSSQRLRRTVHVSRRSKERCVADGLVDPGVLERRIQAKVSPIPRSSKKAKKGAKKGFLPGMVDAAAGGDIGCTGRYWLKFGVAESEDQGDSLKERMVRAACPYLLPGDARPR